MNKFFSLLAAAFLFTAASASASTTAVTLNQDVDNVQVSQVTYSVQVLAIHPDGNRAFHSSKHRSLTEAHMTYQAFVLELPDGSDVVRAEIVDSNGRVILSIS